MHEIFIKLIQDRCSPCPPGGYDRSCRLEEKRIRFPCRSRKKDSVHKTFHPSADSTIIDRRGKYKAVVSRRSIQKTIDLIDSGLQFDSIFCTSDGKALYVIRALHQKGYRIPEDVGVIGFDNIDVSALIQPPLTTVSQQPYEGGRTACRALIRQIEYKRKYGTLPQPQFHEMEPELIIRQSTK